MRKTFALLAALSLTAACSEVAEPDDLQCPALEISPGPMIEVSQGRVMTPEEAQIFGMGAMFTQRAEAAPEPAADAPRRVAPPRPKVKVAVLSAGGQFGAFTAGFMAGWSQNQAAPRPEAFDIVTGVSTGALLAPYVFAGSEYDVNLETIYNGVREDEVFRRRGPLELLGSPSLWEPNALRQQITDNLDKRLWDQIAADSEDRTLLVGSVNLNSGFFEAFDLTSVAAKGGATAPDCFTEALMASSAIPVAFPPRKINGDLYIDGAARQGLFFRGLAQARVDPEIYVFLNNPAAFPSGDPEYALPPLAGRATQILSDELLRSSAEDAVRFAQSQGWTIRGLFAPDIEPGPDCINRGGQKASFCESFTAALYADGFAKATASPIPWLGADELIERLGDSRHNQRTQ